MESHFTSLGSGPRSPRPNRAPHGADGADLAAGAAADPVAADLQRPRRRPRGLKRFLLRHLEEPDVTSLLSSLGISSLLPSTTLRRNQLTTRPTTLLNDPTPIPKFCRSAVARTRFLALVEPLRLRSAAVPRQRAFASRRLSCRFAALRGCRSRYRPCAWRAARGADARAGAGARDLGPAVATPVRASRPSFNSSEPLSAQHQLE